MMEEEGGSNSGIAKECLLIVGTMKKYPCEVQSAKSVVNSMEKAAIFLYRVGYWGQW